MSEPQALDDLRPATALPGIENAHIVGRAHAWDGLFILCADAKVGRRRLVADVQGTRERADRLRRADQGMGVQATSPRHPI